MANNKFFIAKNGILTPVRGVFGTSTDNGVDALQVTGSTLLTGPAEITGLVELTDTTSNGPTGGQQAVTITGGLEVGGWVHFDSAGQSVVFNSDNALRTILEFRQSGNTRWNLELQADGDLDFVSQGAYTLRYNDNEILTSNSAIDADTLDGLDSTQFLRSDQDDTMFGSLIITGDLTVSGNTTTVNTEEVNIADNIILLNSNYTGSSPTENAGIEIERGTLTNSSLIWDEANDWWKLVSAGSDLGRIITTADEGPGNGFDADTVDGLEADQFLRSDVDDIAAGNITIQQDLTIGDGVGNAYIIMDGAGTNRRLYGSSGEIGFLTAALGYSAYSDVNDNWLVPAGNIYAGQDLIAGSDVFANNNIITSGGNIEATVGSVTAGTTVNAGTSLNAPIFIDSDDPAYFVNPNTDSRLLRLGIDDEIFHIGDTGTKLLYTTGDISLQIGNTEKIGIENTRVDITVDLYVPKIIDADDPTYYLDPNDATTSLNVAGDIVTLGDVSANNATFSGDVNADNVIAVNDVSANNVTATNDVVGKRFVDADNNAYFVDPNGDSQMNTIDIDDYIRHRGDLNTYFGFNAADQIQFNTNGIERFLMTNNFNLSGVDLRSATFTDSQDLTYYAEFRATSRLNNIALVGKIHKDADVDVNIQFPGADQIEFQTAGLQQQLITNTYVQATNEYRAPIYRDSINTAYYWDPNTSNAHRLQTPSGYLDLGPMNTSYSHFQTDRPRFYFREPVNFDGNIQGHGGDETAQFAQFIDSQDVNFYGDFASTSRINNVDLVGLITHDGDADTYIEFPNPDEFRVQVGGNTALFANTTVLSTDLDFEAGDGTFSGDVTANNVTATTAMYAPIYYDSDNLAYYGDFAGTSEFNKIHVGNVASLADGTDPDISTSILFAQTKVVTDRLVFLNDATGDDNYIYHTDANTAETIGTSNDFGATYYFVGDKRAATAANSAAIRVSGVKGNYAEFLTRTHTPLVYDTSNQNYFLDVDNIWQTSSGPILRIYESSWTNANQHDVLVNGYFVNTGDYLLAKASGNSATNHGAVVIADNVIGFGRNNGAFNSVNDSATAPLDNTWAYLTSQYFQHNTQIRAPIYYDSDDVNFYLDPNSASRLSKVDFIAAGTTITDQINLYSSDQTNRYSFLVDNNDSDNLRIYRNNSEQMRFEATLTRSYVDFHAPRFIDSDDINYLLDPANSTTSLLAAGSLRVTNITNGTRWLDTTGNGGVAINGYGWDAATGNPNIAISGANGNNSLLYLNRAAAPDFNPYTISNTWIEFRRQGVEAATFSVGPDLTSGQDDNLYLLLKNSTAGPAGGNNFQIWDSALQPLLAVQHDGQIFIGQYYSTHTVSDNTPLVGSIANNRVHIETGSIQLNDANGAIVFGTGTSTFLKDEELGFGWGGGIYMTEATTLRVRNGKDFLTTGNVYAGAFYDDDDNNYYVDPAGDSQLNTIDIDDYIRHRGDLNTYIGFAANDTFRVWTGGTQRVNIDTDSADFAVNVYAPRYYDSNDTAYYVDPAGTSYLNTANFYSFYGNNTGANNEINVGRNASERIRLYVTDSLGYMQYWQDETDATNHSFRFEILSASTGTNQFYFNKAINVTGDITSSGNMYASIYYDNDDTNYYVDPNGDSQMNTIDIDDYIRHRGDLNTYMGFGGTDQWRVVTNNSIRILTTDTYTRITPEVRSPLFVDNDDQNYFGDFAGESRMNTIKLADNQVILDQPTGTYGSLQITGGAFNGYEGFSINGRTVFMHDNADTSGLYNDVDNQWYLLAERAARLRLYYNGVEQARTENGYFRINNEIHSPIFRDLTSPTSWYVDPSSTSRINKLEIVSTAADAFVQGGYQQNNPVESQWYQQGTYSYSTSQTPNTQYYWIPVGVTNNGGAKGFLEYYAKDDVNYSGNLVGRIVISSWNNSTISIDHHTTGPLNSATPRVRVDNNNRIWMQMDSITWDSYVRWHWVAATGITLENGSAKQLAQPANSIEILTGQQVRATLGNVTGATVTNTTHHFGNVYARDRIEAGIYYPNTTTSYYMDLDVGNTSNALRLPGRIERVNFQTSGNGDNNKLLVAQDYTHWIWNTATDWGIFWAGNDNPAYSYFGTSNPNELVFVGNGNVRASIDLDNGNAYFGGEVYADNFNIVGPASNISLNPAYGSGGADLVLFDFTQYSEAELTAPVQGNEVLNVAQSSYIEVQDSPFAGKTIRVTDYRRFYSDYIPVVPGEVIYGEISERLVNTAGGTGGRTYYGVERYDKDKRPIAGNSGTTYFVRGGQIASNTGWETRRAHTTIPTSHTPYNGSDGGGVHYIRIRILMNYPGGTGYATRDYGGIMLKRRNAESNLLADDLELLDDAIIGGDLTVNGTGGINVPNGPITAGGDITSGGDVIGKRFVDADSTGYFVDPEGISNMGGIRLRPNPTGQGYGNGINALPAYYIGQDRGDNDFWRIYGESPSGTNTGNLIIQSEDDYDSNESIRFRFKRTYTDYVANDVLQAFYNYVYSPNSFRAPIFYDSNNTNRYSNQAGESRFQQLRLFDWLRVDTYGSIGGQTINGQSHYQWEGATYRNPNQHTPTLLLRADNTTNGINGFRPALSLYNNEGDLNSTVGMAFTMRETTGSGNAVNLAGIVAEKTSAGNANAWSQGRLRFFVKNFGTRVDGLTIQTNGNIDLPAGGNISTTGNVYAGRYYDDDNNNYWGDFASESRMQRIRLTPTAGYNSSSAQPAEIFLGDTVGQNNDRLRESRRPNITLRGQYPEINLISSRISNSNHGPTLRFMAYDSAGASSGNHKHWVIGTQGTNATRLSFGYSPNQDNVHYGININWSTGNNVAIMWLENNRHVYAENTIYARRFTDRDSTSYYVEPGDFSNLRYLGFDGDLAWRTSENVDRGNIILGWRVADHGYKLYRDEEFRDGTNSTNIYNNAGGSALTRARLTGVQDAPNETKVIYRYTYNGGSNGTTPGYGGFYHATPTARGRVIVARFKARLKVGANFNWASNSIGSGGTSYWLTNRAGTGNWEEYAYVVISGTSNFSSTMFFFVSGSFSPGETLFDLASTTVFRDNNHSRHQSREYEAQEMYSSIYYDRDNTTYRLDPTGETYIRRLKVNTFSSSSNTRALTIKNDSSATPELNFGAYPGAWTSALQIQNNDNTNLVWISPLQSSENARFRSAGSGLDFYTDGTATNTGTHSGFIGTGYVRGVQSIRAPIFYDDNGGTAWYVDPSGTSNVNSVIFDLLRGPNTSSYDKIRVYDSSAYAIGMVAGHQFGDLSDWAMTFRMNNDNDRGFWWGDNAMGTTTGAMSLSTRGRLTVAEKLRVGFGQGDLSGPNGGYTLDINGGILSNAGMYAPIYYDSNDAANYYLDPNSSSFLSAVYADNYFRPEGGSGVLWVSQSDGQNRGIRSSVSEGNPYGNISTMASASPYWSGYGIRSHQALMSDPSGNLSGYHDNSQSWVWYYLRSDAFTYFPRNGLIVNNQVRAGIYYDVDTTWYINLNGSYSFTGSSYEPGYEGRVANFNWGFTSRAKAALGLPGYRNTSLFNLQKITRNTITGNEWYWTGAAGWGTTNMNDIADYKSGFFDTWSNPPNQPAGTSHWVGVQSYHYSRPGGAKYGWQMMGGPIQGLWFRSTWGSWRSYRKIAMYGLNEVGAGDLYATRYYSTNNAYYVDPDGFSNMTGNIRNDEYYSRSWYRNDNSGTGLYNEATQMHWYSDNARYYNIAPGSTGTSGDICGIRFRQSNGGAIRGYVYQSGLSFGLLGYQGSWRVQIVNGDWVDFAGSSARAARFYDRNATTYYWEGGEGGANSTYVNGHRANTHWFGNYNASAPGYANNPYNPASGTGNTKLGRIREISFKWNTTTNYDDSTYHGIRSTDINNSFSDEMSLNSYNDIILRIDSNNNNTNSYVRISDNSPTNGQFAYIGRQNGTAIAYLGTGDVYGGRFRDTGDSNFWCDPAGQSRFNTLTLSGNRLGFINTTFDAEIRVSDANPDGTGAVFNFWGDTVEHNAEVVTEVFRATRHVRANTVYRTADNAYYLQPGSNSRVAGFIRTEGNRLYIRGTSPTLTLQDTNNRSSHVHCNSNLHYVLRGTGNDSTSWSTSNGYWPVYWNLENNDALFGRNISAIGNITAFASDRRLKDNIKPIENALDKIMQLKGVTFDWNDTAIEAGFQPKVRYNDVGVISQDVEKVLPQLVELAPFDSYVPNPASEEDELSKLGTSKSGENYTTVDYSRLSALTIEAIKEQQEIINSQKKEIDELKELVQKLIEKIG